jgi:two-component system, chemotaxis family, protein-glutamate methylesterase/glutaminase
MMRSAASVFQSRVIGIIMTGMGSDGVLGMKAIHQAGGWTIGQDEDTCAAYGMPRTCVGSPQFMSV